MSRPFFGSDPREPRTETTGRYLVLLDQGEKQAGIAAVQRATDTRIADAHDLPAGTSVPPSGADGLMFPELGVAVVEVPPEGAAGLLAVAHESSAVHVVEAERVVYATTAAPSTESQFYLRGYRDAVNALVEGIVDGVTEKPNGRAEHGAPNGMGTRVWDESQSTWGLQATAVIDSIYSGRGVKVAVLDTGFDLKHPDFADRRLVTQSFVPGQDVQDVVGHGTHCVGTACGPRQPGVAPRYGVAYNADIFVGKVLDNTGRGTDTQILAGISWAVRNGCHIVSMSLGAPTVIGQSPSAVFENAARRALDQGTLVIAAAGNESRRQDGSIQPVGHPANCPSILAVAAVDENLDVALFSCGGVNPNGGEVNVAAPGVRVHSTWPMPSRYKAIMGTSMATPHVAGIAALLVEAKPGISATDLADLLATTAKRLPLPARDVGTGLVQAP
ncbi:S8 family serine peptidase [Frankia sp. CNm7]|uniref:S8 family serine peptidase n=1 Tax=Frankia nepalensis TaxID=1836974 RepID=A0A937RGP1_9ACTN|nr:S8 family serine peptidase [Frankia nepalensis]MBL7498427.1 S8 family serine peptidase [Frankia nepalensis]MBL7509959.1 S8 family serine peptidase [Frankia nepalensis]MBL7520177.1 S8 family serine peptidase [Frankia nepalensis]MBL7629757.1 S8 family serine peptidase [Frankia nepalensis]